MLSQRRSKGSLVSSVEELGPTFDTLSGISDFVHQHYHTAALLRFGV
jgi:hypothetical protein